MKSLLLDLIVNLRQGLRVMFLRPVAPEDFRVSPDQLIALVTLGFAVRLVIGLAFIGPHGFFNIHALTAEMTVIGALLFAAFLIARLTGDPRLLLGFPVAVLAMGVWFLALQGPVRWTMDNYPSAASFAVAWNLHFGFLAWYVAAPFAALARFAPGRVVLGAAGYTVYLVLYLGSYWVLPPQDLWLARQGDMPRAQQASVAEEAAFHAQPLLLEASLAALKPGRPGIPDVYFVGFGAYSREDVFMKEVRVIDELFRSRFDAEGRTVALINNPQTVAEVPVASATNLARVLRHIGSIMNREEDLVVLYLTTHGSDKHRLSVVNWPLALQEIDPPALARMLEESGIQWRVLVISACYSGGFVEALKNDTTLVMTAAAADRQSFGCGADSEFTYFGRALFDEQLRHTFSFTEAFERARQVIAERERAQKFQPSNPQIHAGAAIAKKLRAVESRLQWLASVPPLTEEDR